MVIKWFFTKYKCKKIKHVQKEHTIFNYIEQRPNINETVNKSTTINTFTKNIGIIDVIWIFVEHIHNKWGVFDVGVSTMQSRFNPIVICIFSIIYKPVHNMEVIALCLWCKSNNNKQIYIRSSINYNIQTMWTIFYQIISTLSYPCFTHTFALLCILSN